MHDYEAGVEDLYAFAVDGFDVGGGGAELGYVPRHRDGGVARDAPPVEEPFEGELGVGYADVGIHGDNVREGVVSEEGEEGGGEDPGWVVAFGGVGAVEVVGVVVDLGWGVLDTSEGLRCSFDFPSLFRLW